MPTDQKIAIALAFTGLMIGFSVPREWLPWIIVCGFAMMLVLAIIWLLLHQRERREKSDEDFPDVPSYDQYREQQKDRDDG